MDTKKNEKSSIKKTDEWVKEEDTMSRAEKLEIELADLKSKFNLVMEKLNEEKESEGSTDDYPRDIRQDDYIPVMSLLPYTLNLSTQGMGRGKIKKFRTFGEVKRILYSELVDIMEAHPNFVNAGYIYIMDKDVIRKHGLNDVYENILDKDKMEKILDTKDTEDCITLYKEANKKQQEIIIRLLISKMKEDPDSVNLNFIDKVSKMSDINIQEKVSDSIAFNEALMDEKNKIQ